MAQVTIANNFLMDLNYVLEKDSDRRYIYFFSRRIGRVWESRLMSPQPIWNAEMLAITIYRARVFHGERACLLSLELCVQCHFDRTRGKTQNMIVGREPNCFCISAFFFLCFLQKTNKFLVLMDILGSVWQQYQRRSAKQK